MAEHHAGINGTLAERLITETRQYLEKIERKLARVVVRAESRQVQLLVDGRPIEPLGGPSPPTSRPMAIAGTRELGKPEAVPSTSFELLLDPGQHVFAVSRGDKDRLISRHFRRSAGPTASRKSSSRRHPDPRCARGARLHVWRRLRLPASLPVLATCRVRARIVQESARCKT